MHLPIIIANIDFIIIYVLNVNTNLFLLKKQKKYQKKVRNLRNYNSAPGHTLHTII